jgi:hypothetical protein
MQRKTRSDKGKKRVPGSTSDQPKPSIGTRIRNNTVRAAKYGAGLYVGSKIYGAGQKAGQAITNRLASRIAPNAVEGSLVDKAKTAGKLVGTLVVADQTAKGVGRLTNLAKRKREERLERKRD